MTKKFLLIALICAAGISAFIHHPEFSSGASSVVEISVDPTRQVGTANRLALGGELYYQFMDEVNGSRGYPNAPYTWIDEMAVELKRSGVTILRYPGGSTSDMFSWYEGIGPISERQPVCRANDYGYYHFGIAEFLNLAKKAGAQVVYTANEDRAEPEEIRRLAEYTNMPITDDILSRAGEGKWTADMWRGNPLGVPEGYYAWLRTQSGYGNTAATNPGEPWKIQYWEIGNEIYAPYCETNRDGHPECDLREGCPNPPGVGRKYPTVMAPVAEGQLNPEEGVLLYINRLVAFSDAIRSIDSSVKIGVPGYNYCPSCLWNKELLRNQTAASKFDFITDHPYAPLATKPADWPLSEYNQAVVSAPYHEEKYLLNGWASILGNKKLAVTEYNADYGVWPDYGEYAIDLRGGLQTAGRFQMYLRSPNVILATYHHMRMRGMFDWRGNPAVPGPSGLALGLYTKYLKSVVVQSSLASNTTHSVRNIGLTNNFESLAIPDIDVFATASSDGKELSLFIINRNVKVAHTLELNTGSMKYSSMVKETMKTVYPEGSDEALLATNSIEKPNQVYVETESSRAAPETFSIAPATLMVLNFSGGTSVPVEPELISADILANNSNGPISIPWNSAATIRWTSANAAECSVLPSGWSGVSGQQSTGNLTSSRVYSVTCSGPGVPSVTDQVVVNVTGVCEAPSIISASVIGVASSSAVLAGTFVPGSMSVSARFEYGTSADVLNKTTALQVVGGSIPQTVTASLSGLSKNTTYYGRLVVRGGCDQTEFKSSVFSFKTLSELAPTVAIGANGLSGVVSVKKDSILTLRWNSANAVSCAISPRNWSGLSGEYSFAIHEDETYMARCVGADGSIATSAVSVRVSDKCVSPTVTTMAARDTNISSSLLSGAVNPNGENIRVHFEYGATPSMDKRAGEWSMSGNVPVEVAIPVANLLPTARYYFRLVAESGCGGVQKGAVLNFSTGSSVNMPSADIKLNGFDMFDTIRAGDAITLTWNATSVSACAISPGNITGISGTKIIDEQYAAETFVLTCESGRGPVSDSVSVLIFKGSPDGGDIGSDGETGACGFFCRIWNAIVAFLRKIFF